MIYNLYFRNFYPFDAHVQQDLGVLGKHRYDMQDLLNAVSYTFMAMIPLTLGFRLVFLLAGLFQRQFFIFIVRFWFWRQHVITLNLTKRLDYENSDINWIKWSFLFFQIIHAFLFLDNNHFFHIVRGSSCSSDTVIVFAQFSKWRKITISMLRFTLSWLFV